MAHIAELEAEAAVLEKRRSLEEQKLRLQQEQEHLTLETELAKSKAKEQVLSLILEAVPRSFMPKPINLESRKAGETKAEVPIIGLETASWSKWSIISRRWLFHLKFRRSRMASASVSN